METNINHIIIKNALVVNSQSVINADVEIINEKIVQIGCIGSKINESVKIIDATGCYLLPGAIDPHVHLHLKTSQGYSSDDFFTGSRAAIAGGTTTIIDFVTPENNESQIQAFEKRIAQAANCQTDYALHASVVSNKLDCKELDECYQKYGFSSIKVYMAYKNTIGIDDATMLQTMQYAANKNMTVLIHAENGDMIDFLQKKYVAQNKTQALYHPLSRPDVAETDAVTRALNYARITKCKIYFVHVSTNKAVALIAKYRTDKNIAYIETCPQYLVLNDENYKKIPTEAAKYIISPPLRNEQNTQRLWNHLTNNNIDVVATDHCPFNYKGQKDKYIYNFAQTPNGAGGIEHRLSLLYSYGVKTEKITINQLVRLIAENPAKIFNLAHRKGFVQEGFDADLVIWNPNTKNIISQKTQFQNCDHNIYEGLTIYGEAQTVFLRGKIVYNNKKFYTNTNGIYLR